MHLGPGQGPPTHQSLKLTKIWYIKVFMALFFQAIL